jgi:outer membrane lipoprotein-sorting protein
LTRLDRAFSIDSRPRCTRRDVVLAAVVLAFGCATAKAPSPPVPFRKPRTATLEEVLTAYDEYCKSTTTLSASGELEVRDLRASRPRRVGVRMLAGRDGRLYLKASVAFVTALELVADGRHFWFQVPSKKTVWTGAVAAEESTAEGEGVPYRALRPQDLTASVLPDPIEPKEDDQLLMEADRETFSLTLARRGQPRGVVRRRVWLDREQLRPVRLRAYDDNGDLLREAVLGQWADDGPHRVEVSRPVQGYAAVFELSKIERNLELPARAFAPRTPQGYSVVEVKE